MKYNSSRKKLLLKEYGRHVQYIVENCMKEQDREKRNQFAKEIVELMGQLNPHLRNVEDFRHKLWDHLFIMSDYQLDVDSPYPIKKREEVEQKPQRLAYPQSRIRLKHYGKNVESLIAKAIGTEDDEKRTEFTACIGNFMKLVYQSWGREDVSNETIKSDIRILSGDKLILADDQDLDTLTRANRFKPKQENMHNGGHRKGGGGKNRNGGRNKNFKKRR